jgi:hypothetical protein
VLEQLVLPDEEDEREAEMAGRRLRRRWVEDEEAGAAERKAAAVAVAAAVVVGDTMVMARSHCFGYLICLGVGFGFGWRLAMEGRTGAQPNGRSGSSRPASSCRVQVSELLIF